VSISESVGALDALGGQLRHRKKRRGKKSLFLITERGVLVDSVLPFKKKRPESAGEETTSSAALSLQKKTRGGVFIWTDAAHGDA